MNYSELQAIIWDMDGVLVYTNEYHYQAWRTIYRRFSNEKEPLARSTFDSVFGMRNDMTVKQLFGDERATAGFIDRVGEEKEILFRKSIQGRMEPLPGIWTWLTYFQSQGLRQAVASSAPEANIEAILDEIEAWSFFEVVLSGHASDSMASKPAPDIFLEAASRLNVPPSFCLVVEDSVVGVQAAKAAGMACLAVTTTSPAGVLSAADWVIDSFNEIHPQVME